MGSVERNGTGKENKILSVGLNKRLPAREGDKGNSHGEVKVRTGGD